MSFVRIRLTFERPLPLKEVKNCWFLVDTSTCSTIADLEYLIKKRFKALSKSCSSVDLFLDDYLLPSQEKIEILQSNDNVRVEVQQLKQESSYEESEDQAIEKRKELKRKKRERDLPDTSYKSKRKGVDNSEEVVNETKKKKKKIPEKEEQNDETTKTQSKKTKKEKGFSQASKNQVKEQEIECKVHKKHKSNEGAVAQNEIKSTKTVAFPSTSTYNAHVSKSSKPSKGKSKIKQQNKADAGKWTNTSEPLKTNSKRSKTSVNGKGKDIITGKKAVDCEGSSSESSSSTESSSASTDESGPSNSHSILNGTASPEASAVQINKNKSPVRKGLGKNVRQKTSIESLPVKLPNGKERKGETGGRLKSSLVTHCSSKGSGTTRASTSSSSSSYSSSSIDSSSNSSSDANKSKFTMSKDVRKPSLSSSLPSSLLSSSSGGNEKEKTNFQNNKKTSSSLLRPMPLSSSPSLLSSPSILRSIQMDTTIETSVNQTPMSSITDKSNPSGQKKQSTRKNKKPESNISTGHIRFDSDESDEDSTDEQQDVSSLMNISDDLNTNTQLYEQTEHQTRSHGAVSKLKEPAKRDYSVCIPLHGPPRSGDKIAYKVLELSASYTPEVSSYKEGTVLAFDPSSGAIKVVLTKESLKRALGDGNVTGKFELVYDENEENVQEESPEVVVLWSSMIEPVLIE